MSEAQDKIFFRNFSLVVIAIAVMMIIFIIVARLAGIDDDTHAVSRAEKIEQMTAPVGRLNVEQEGAEEDTAEAMAAGGDAHPGQATYDGLCVNCHGIPAMAAMFPQTGDIVAWEARIAQGIDVLYDHAINGFTGEMGLMPARGGNPALSDEQVKAAVDYMVSKVSAETGVALEMANASSADVGQKVYDGLCVNCHGVAVLAAMIPQTGDVAIWEARIARGIDVLYDHAINGFTGEMGMMPARGGNPELSDEQVKAAVDYMIKQSQ